ncbi:hypothetical protein [Rhodoblastus acidophilus]|nr:hypothetical protein [Rhodoblastus acidophilus]PPQ37616.1 hypothetical protein CKO16_13595 [Rhodoblastus acidophilus]RAI19104.1 hypothetical protein CH337_12810 [Rhodoblastus acidophilus]
MAERPPTRSRNGAPKAFPPLGAEFEPFLYAVLYEDGHGMPLTMVSAIARSGADPWKEAARIAKMPKPLALDALAGLMPGRSDATVIADRMLALLQPARRMATVPLIGGVHAKPRWSPLVPAILILLLILTLAAVFRRTPHIDAGAFEQPAAPVAEKADP